MEEGKKVMGDILKSEEAKDFITRLLCVDPAQRLTASQVGEAKRSEQ